MVAITKGLVPAMPASAERHRNGLRATQRFPFAVYNFHVACDVIGAIVYRHDDCLHFLSPHFFYFSYIQIYKRNFNAVGSINTFLESI